MNAWKNGKTQGGKKGDDKIEQGKNGNEKKRKQSDSSCESSNLNSADDEHPHKQVGQAMYIFNTWAYICLQFT